jgi:exodeoxyribonuclease V gamma subunit
MVCLLGMNDAEYPRDVRPHSFDLIANSHPEKGDRSKKLDDRYLFLEAIGSAQDTFYVSYIGKGARDNKDRPPSVVVSEWENYLAEVFTDIETIEHALQPFNRRYYQGDQRQSYSTSWFHALTAKSTPTAFQAGAIRQSDTDCASTNQLSAFLRHPARYYLQQRLNVYFDSEEVELKDTETFEPDHLERFNMADQALIAMINEQDLDQFRHAEMHSGKMLGGAIGEFQLEREINRAKNIYAEVTGYLNAPAAPLKTSVTIQSTDLQFELDSIYGDHIVNFRAGTLRARQLLDAWINHLAANCVLKDINTVCIFKGKDDVAETLRLKPVHEQEASSHLEYLLSLYRQGNEVPLFLPPEASRFLVEETRKGLELQPAVDRTRQHWRNDQLGTESSDRYWARLFDFPEVLNGQFPDDALCVWTPILDSIADE